MNKKYKQDVNVYGDMILIDDDGDVRHLSKISPYFTKVEENKELEEAKEYLSGYAKGAYPIKPKLKKSIEIILKNLDNENKN